MPAGLPSFNGLTNSIIKELGSEKAIEAFDREECDRAFNALVREFGRDEIDTQLFKHLRKPWHCDLSNHENLLTLSRSTEGKARLVTTNFDLLFERAERGLRVNVPPVMPNLDAENVFHGLVYLHGRLTSPRSKEQPNYIVSSSDFGRAYLSEGWATRFIKSLREQYAIVLVGYRAEDPPVRYLLEGLHSVRDDRYSHPIYTFTPGTEHDAKELWAERGVTPITYQNRAGDHSDLWQSIDAWAAMVREPERWKASTIKLAQEPPRGLRPHERGQVCYLVSSADGAKAFAQADPVPSADWFCVFDPHCRYAEPGGRIWDGGTEIDPFDLYCIDDDPPRPIREGHERPAPPGRDFLGWQHADGNVTDHVHFAFWHPLQSSPFPPRLSAIASWFRRVIDQPGAIWWAAGRSHLNPHLAWYIERGLEESETSMPQEVIAFWRYYQDSFSQFHPVGHDLRWYDFANIVKREGWTTSSLRLLERSARPYVQIKRAPMREPVPPIGTWDEVRLGDCADLDIRVLDRHNDKIEVPNEYLALVVSIVRRSLEETARLMAEIGKVWWSAPTLHPTGEAGEHFSGRKVQFFLWFKSLFEQLIAQDAATARAELHRWSHDDPIFFGRLVTFFAADSRLFAPNEAAALLTKLSDDVFWDRGCQRELLFALREIWPHLKITSRRVIEKRIVAGEKKWPAEKPAEHRNRQATQSLTRLRWMQLQGLPLSKAVERKLPQLKRRAAPRWSDEWAKDADDSLGARGGMVARITASQGLEKEPINNVLLAAESKTEDRLRELRDYRPFVGLVKQAPFRALSALRYGLRKGEFPQRFWENLLFEWPDDTSLRLKRLLIGTLAGLEAQNALALRHYAPDWLEKNIDSLRRHNRSFALRSFDKILAPYLSADPENLKSGIGSTAVGGVAVERSEVSINKAINSPGGKFARALWELVPKPRKKRDMPADVRKRYAQLFGLPGYGGGHAVAVVTQRLGWLDYWYQSWVHSTFLPLFDLENPLSEAAWHGLAYDRNGLSHASLKKMHASLLDLFGGEAAWALDDSEYRHHLRRLVALTQPDLQKGAIIKFAEARKVLIAVDDKGRAEAVSMLSYLMKEKGTWKTFVKPFLKRAWPKQLQYKGELSSRAFASLLAESGDDFPDVAKIIMPLVRPVPHLDMFSYQFSKDEGEDDFSTKFPKETLLALDAFIDESRPTIPYGLATILDAIGDAQPELRKSQAWRRLKDLSL